jgi:hypothetical protein
LKATRNWVIYIISTVGSKKVKLFFEFNSKFKNLLHFCKTAEKGHDNPLVVKINQVINPP